MVKTSDIIPIGSGLASLGVNQGPNGGAFDFNSIAPFSHIHLNSGVFHHATSTGWESGIIRFNSQIPSFQISLNGGITFANLATSAGTVTSIGVIGDADLAGAVDFATRASGFMIIEDTADASPLLWAVDNQGLSGFWRFPTQGFNGRVVNAFTDFNGTEAQGVISVVGASGIVVDIIGQTLTISNGNATPKCFAATFGAATSWTVTHNLNSLDVNVMVLDDASPRNMILPDNIEVTSANVVTVTFNASQGGRAIVIAC